eukprot:4930417-Prorocentrum_lima.AAC.1
MATGISSSSSSEPGAEHLVPEVAPWVEPEPTLADQHTAPAAPPCPAQQRDRGFLLREGSGDSQPALPAD